MSAVGLTQTESLIRIRSERPILGAVPEDDATVVVNLIRLRNL